MEAAAKAGVEPAKSLADLRGDFPIFERSFDGKPLIYLDSAATSQKPQKVIEAIDSYYREHNANIHRAVYRLGIEATEIFEGARQRVAGFVGATVEETIFVRNATEAINLVAYSWGRTNINEGDTVLITQMEHHSNIVPWQLLCEARGAKLKYLAIDEGGKLDRSELERYLEQGVKLFAVTHVSNVLGTLNPVRELVALAHLGGATVLVDGAQAVPQMPVDVAEVGADFYAFTGHKMLGPTGIGVLYGRRELLEAMPPFVAGGDMIKSVEFERSTWNDLPWKFEAGTSAVAEGAGLGAAVDYLRDVGMQAIREHERELTRYALGRLGEIEGLTIFGPASAEDRGGVISFAIAGMHPHDIAELLDRDAVCIRAGHHCAQPLMRTLGVAATARASFGVYNDRADVDRMVAALQNAKQVFGV